MRNSEKISIIIPAYNIEKYIATAVDSALNQTYTNIEVIVVNDGSTDNTKEVLDELELKDHRIKVIHKINEGVTKARLTGVSVAGGEWIGFLDGDDKIDEDMYEKLLVNAYKYRAEISHCGYKMVFPNRVVCYHGTGRVVLQDNNAGLKELLSGKFVEPGLWNKLYRKELFTELVKDNLMDLSIKNNEDLLMNYYLFKQAKRSVYEDICPYHYLVRANSTATSKTSENRLRDPIKVLKLLCNDVENTELKCVVERRLLYRLVAAATNSLQGQPMFVEEVQKEARYELRKNIKKVFVNNRIDIKLKIMVIWVVVWPTSYRAIHQAYAKITGLDKKYTVE